VALAAVNSGDKLHGPCGRGKKGVRARYEQRKKIEGKGRLGGDRDLEPKLDCIWRRWRSSTRARVSKKKGKVRGKIGGGLYRGFAWARGKKKSNDSDEFAEFGSDTTCRSRSPGG
jgi:hypothetical protein